MDLDTFQFDPLLMAEGSQPGESKEAITPVSSHIYGNLLHDERDQIAQLRAEVEQLRRKLQAVRTLRYYPTGNSSPIKDWIVSAGQFHVPLGFQIPTSVRAIIFKVAAIYENTTRPYHQLYMTVHLCQRGHNRQGERATPQQVRLSLCPYNNMYWPVTVPWSGAPDEHQDLEVNITDVNIKGANAGANRNRVQLLIDGYWW